MFPSVPVRLKAPPTTQAFISGAGDADLYLIMARTGGPGVATG